MDGFYITINDMTGVHGGIGQTGVEQRIINKITYLQHVHSNFSLE